MLFNLSHLTVVNKALLAPPLLTCDVVMFFPFPIASISLLFLSHPLVLPLQDSSYIVRNRAASGELVWKPIPSEPDVDTLNKVFVRYVSAL